ncbi:MAG: ATP-binding protein [Proteobacteria bacterium]|nr:ATP-binding protein [Pseudomonadota bacterium]
MLHLICGKIAAGKSTLAAELGRPPGTVTLNEDFLLARLYPGEIRTIDDYARCAARLCEAIGPHVVAMLKAGVTVVLDFQANTLKRRAWMRGLIDQAGVAHRLHYLDVPDDVCKQRLRARNAAGTHEYAASDAEFDLFTSYFVPPAPEEGFDVVVHRPT